jgi:hypothetical protein
MIQSPTERVREMREFNDNVQSHRVCPEGRCRRAQACRGMPSAPPDDPEDDIMPCQRALRELFCGPALRILAMLESARRSLDAQGADRPGGRSTRRPPARTTDRSRRHSG